MFKKSGFSLALFIVILFGTQLIAQVDLSPSMIDDLGFEAAPDENIGVVNTNLIILTTALDDQSPIFTSATMATFTENGTGTVYTAVATDDNTITYSLGTSNDEGLFDIVGSTGVVTFKAAPDFESPIDSNTDNVYELMINATDGTNTSSITVQIQVVNVQEFNPVFSTTPITEINEGTDYKYEAKVSDADNAGLFINVTTKPSWMEIEPVLEVSTLAGKLPSSFKNGTANEAVFNQAHGLTFDNAGNLFVADAEHHQIRRIAIDGTVSTFAGNGVPSFKDGPAQLAGFNSPYDVAFDAAGNLFVAERNNHAIRKIDKNGNVTTVAGNGNSGLMDGKGSNGQFDLPTDIAFDTSGNLFVATATRIKKVDQNGNVTTFLGGGSVIKNGTIDQLRNPHGMAIDQNNNIYFGESNGLVTKASPQGIAVTFAGSGTPGFLDGVGTNAQIGSVAALTFDSIGNLFFSDANNRRIRKISPDGTVSTVAGTGVNGSVDGPISTGTIEGARDLAFHPNGDIYFTDGSRKVRRVTTGGTVEFVAGKAIVSGSQGNDGLGTNATFSFLNRSAVDSNGNLYVTDQSTGIRKISPEGLVTTFSTGLTGAVFDIFIDQSDQIFYTDVLNNVIRKLNPDGTSALVYGKEGRGFADGTSTDALFSNPYGLVIDSNGNFFVADQINDRIRKITPSGVVSTFAGSTNGYQDGTGTNALFSRPSGLTIDKDDNLYVADRGNSRIRRITPSGIVSTVAGSGTSSQNIDGLGTSASFVLIEDIDIDKSGNLWVAGGNVIRMISPSGRVTTVAGTGQAAFRDGKANQAQFFSIQGIEVANGALYVTDRGNHSVRKISHSGVTLSGNTNGQAGDHNIVIEATDQQGATTKQEFTLSVFGNGDFAPVFTSGLSQNFLTLTTGIAYQAIATDTKAITYQIGTNNDEALFDIDASNGNLGFKTPPNFSSPQDSNNDNKYLVEVIANNGTRSASQIVTISVIDQIVNTKPVITSNPVTSITDNTSYRYEIKVNDPENDVVTVSASTLPSWMSLKQQSLGAVTTFAGSGVSGASDGTGLAAQFNLPLGLTIDQSDNIYVAELNSKTIRKISPTGEVTTFVGATSNFTEKDGTGSDAGFSGPIGMASDASGNLYVSDNTTSSIRKITPSGVVTTIAGTGVRGYTDGQGAEAQFREPKDLAVDSQGNVFIADHGNNRIRKITPAGLVTTFAGSGEGKLLDGIGTSAAFNRPYGIAIDGSDNLYVADNNNHSIRKITPAGIVTTLAGNGVEGYVDDAGAAARFDNPAHLTSDAVGNLYVADFGNKRIRKVTVDGKVITLAGSDVNAKTDGIGSEAAFNGLFGIVLDSKGDLFISESTSRVIRKMVISGTLPVLIGNTKGQAGSHEVTVEATDTNNGKAMQSFIINISDTPPSFTPIPDLFPKFDENGSGTVFTSKAQDSNNIKYVLGSSFDESFFSIDQSTGVLTFKNSPDFETPLDSDKNNSYFAQIYAFDDRSNSANILVRALVSNVDDKDPSFTSIPVASVNDNADYEYVIKVEDPDGERLQVSAESLPSWLSLESTADGVTTTIAGSGEKKLLDGNGISASFSGPRDLAMDSEGNIYVVDTQNNAIRKMAVDGSITTFAGNGQQGSADGTGATATFNTPRAIVIDKDDNLYISDSGNNRIRKITKSGQVSTFAGNNGGFQDGQGTSAMFSSPRGLAIDANGVIYVADGFNSRIRTISPSGEVATLAGQGGFVYQDGTGTAAGFSFPQDVAVDAQGNVFVADWGNFSIRKITPSGVVTTITGLPDNLGSQNHPSEDGIVASASINGPQGIVVDSEGNIYVTESRAGNVRKITPGGIVTTIAGNDIDGYADGTGTIARFNSPDGLFITPDGSLLIADASNNRIRKVSLGQTKLTGSAVGQAGDHSVALKVNDAEGTAVMQTFTITVSDVTKPVFTSPITANFAENGTGTAYTAVATDANTITYSLGTGNDEGLFDIVSTTGVVTFKSSPDFESPTDKNTDNAYMIEVNANDGTNTATQSIAITVTNVNENPPVFTSATTVSFDENKSGTVYTAQTQSNNGVEFRLSTGSGDESNFILNTTTGELIFNRKPDFEAPRDRNRDNKYELQIVAKSTAGESILRVSVVVTDLPEPPMGAYDVSSAIDAGTTESFDVSSQIQAAISIEFDKQGKRLFILGASDGEIHEYALAIAYDVSSAEYIGQFNTSALLKTESFEALSFRFNNDGSKMYAISRKGLSIREYNLNESYKISSLTYGGVSSDLSLSGSISIPRSFTISPNGDKLFVTDAITNSVHQFKMLTEFDVSTTSYSSTSKTYDFSQFTKHASSIDFTPDGQRMFILGRDSRFIFEFDLSIAFDVSTATYNGDSDALRVATNAALPSAFEFGQNGNKLFLIGSSRNTLSEFYIINSDSKFTSDPITIIDEHQDYTYDITTENSDNSPVIMAPIKPEWITLNGSQISGKPLGNAASSNKNVVLVAEDTKGGFIAQNFTITIVDNSIPVFVSPSTIDFLSGSNEVVVRVQATDPSQLFYSFSFELPDESLFTIDAFTGDLRFKSIPEVSDPKDVNKDNKYELKIRAGDGKNTVTQTIIVHLKAPDHTNPVFTSAISTSFVENGTGTAYTAVATDANAITYSLGTSNDERLFDIVGTSGVITFKTAPDFEAPTDQNSDNTYVIEVKASDGTNTSTQLVTITVTDADEIAPQVVVTSTANALVFTPSFKVTFTFSELVTGFDASDLTVANGTVSDFKGSGNTYSALISATTDGNVIVQIAKDIAQDAAGNNNLVSNTITRTVEATNIAPSTVNLSANKVSENAALAFEVGTLSATDADENDRHTFALVDGTGGTNNSLFRIIGNKLIATATFDYETIKVASIRVRATDTRGLSLDAVKQIEILNITEPKIVTFLPSLANPLVGDANLLFEATRIGQTVTRTFEVTNSGTDGDLSITDITLPTGFTVDKTIATIAQGQKEVLTVTFSPTEEKIYAGAIVITSNAGEHKVRLGGRGKQNRAPIAVSPNVEVFVKLSDLLKLRGYDPDGDAIEFVITQQPQQGTITATTDGLYSFTPNGLSPGQIYQDVLKFKVVETGGGLESAEAELKFKFRVNDQAHAIKSLAVSSKTDEKIVFDLKFLDPVVNDAYQLKVSYYNLSDPTNPVFVPLLDQSITKSIITTTDGVHRFPFESASSGHGYLFNSSRVFMVVELTTANGYLASDGYILRNESSGSSITTIEGAGSTDGEFFVFASQTTVPENESVEVNLFAVDLGSFSLTDATIAITKSALKGTSTAPVEVKKTTNLAQWKLTYSSETEVGLLDSLQFTVTNPSRSANADAYAKVEVIEVADAPVLSAIADQQTNEEEAITVDLVVTDPDSELTITATSSESTNVPVTTVGNKLIITPGKDFNGTANISVLVTESNSSTPLSTFDEFQLTVVPVNDKPVVTAISDLTVVEDSQLVVTLAATDVDGSLPIFTYSASADNQANVSYTIEGDVLTITPTANYNGTITFGVTADDGAGTTNSVSASEAFTITVSPQNDAPTSISTINTQTLLEVIPAYTLDLTQYFTDIETAAKDLTYTVSSISNAGLSISGATLTISSIAGASGVETATITASDGELSVTQNVTFVATSASTEVTVANPVTDQVLAEDFGVSSIDLSNVFALSGNAGASFSYILTGNNTIGASMNGTSLELTSVDNFNGTDELIIIGTADGKSSFTKFKITVNPANDAPSLITAINDETTAEDAVLSKTISSTAFSDVDGDALTYSASYAAAWLSFDAETRTFSGTPSNGDVGTVAVIVTATDPSGATATDSFNLAVSNTNDDPTAITFTSKVLNENIALNSVVSTLTSVDPDAGDDSFTYSLVTGTGSDDNASFDIIGNQLVTASSFDFESKTSYSIRIKTTDGFEGSYTEVVTIAISNVNEAATAIGLPVTTIAENQSTGTIVSALTTTDPDASDSHTYSLVSGTGDTDNASFTITDGNLTTASAFDFETKSSYAVRIKTTDAGGLSIESTFTISISNANEVATDLNLSAATIAENAAISTEVADLITTDPDAGDTHNYSLVAGVGDADNANFKIEGTKLLAASSFNFENKNSYSLRLKSTDASGLSFEKSFTITVTDVNDAPNGITADNLSIEENQVSGTTIGSLSTSDQDSGDTHSYSLVSGEGDADNASFTLEGNVLKTAASYDFETKNSYAIRVKTTDAAGLSFEIAFQVAITNQAEAQMRLENNTTLDPIGIGSTATFNITVFNDGDGAMNVTSITYPEGFSGANGISEIAPSASAELTVTFSPSEAKTYSGDIVLTYNGGEQVASVSATGEVITSIDDGLVDEALIKIYPNPAANEFTLDLTSFNGQPIEILLVDGSGVGVHVAKDIRTSMHTVRVSNYSQGVYIVMLRSSKQSIQKKLVIRR